jgi:signal transduction histidine kinase
VKGAERLEALVNSTLDVAKIENSTLSLTKRAVYMWELFEPIEATYRKVLDARGLKLTIDIASLPPTLADAKLLYRTFDELISNAVKYTPDGGQITVTGDIYTAEEAGDDKANFVHLSVADTGIGIAPDHQRLIFEKFYQLGKVEVHSSSRTNYKGGGPGLGLAVARGIVEAHNGRIWAESPGFDEQNLPGSTFHVLLPLLAWKSPSKRARNEVAPPTLLTSEPGSYARATIVERKPEIIRRVLADTPYPRTSWPRWKRSGTKLRPRRSRR